MLANEDTVHLRLAHSENPVLVAEKPWRIPGEEKFHAAFYY
jgi:hypothetical protein